MFSMAARNAAAVLFPVSSFPCLGRFPLSFAHDYTQTQEAPDERWANYLLNEWRTRVGLTRVLSEKRPVELMPSLTNFMKPMYDRRYKQRFTKGLPVLSSLDICLYDCISSVL